eukprot:scaffold1204_cov179-Amphora_coffeaeformis.AAC.1
MKHDFRCNTLSSYVLFVLLLFLGKAHNGGVTLAATENENANSPQQQKQKGAIRQKHREFGNTLVKNLYVNDNECSSTWGISMLFDLMRPGASRDTETELCDIMGLCQESSPQIEQRLGTRVVDTATNAQESPLVWRSTVNAITTMYDGSCTYEDYGEDGCEQNRPLVAVANSVWVDTGRNMDPTYLLAVDENLHQIEFANPFAAQKVNDWVNATTFGLIDSILNPGSISGELCAVNSIYFNAGWRNFFQEKYSNEDFFYTSPARDTPLSKKAYFMHMAISGSYLKFPYSAEALPGYQVLELGYQQPYGLSMILVLPIKDGLPMVSSNQVMSAKPQLTSRAVAIALPKFQFTSDYRTNQLYQALRKTGVEAPFSLQNPDKGFCGMLVDQCLAISMIGQKTAIHVNEQGTVAAAVSYAVLAGAAPPQPEPDPILFQADHPFQFFICDGNTDVCLFEGIVGAPPIPPGNVAPLQDRHTHEHFWSTNFHINVTKEEGESMYPDPTYPNDTNRSDDNSTDPNADDSQSRVVILVTMFVAILVTAWLRETTRLQPLEGGVIAIVQECVRLASPSPFFCCRVDEKRCTTMYDTGVLLRK